MGASSSKSVNTKYEVRHTVEGQLVSTNISKKGSIKKKNKNSVKVKDGHKKSTSASSQLTPATYFCDTAMQSKLPSRAVYRKKSSCSSCEAKDVLLGKHRSRSGSEKSLRFSDFNKVLRKTRIYDWEMQPLDIALEDVNDPCPDDICFICEVYTGSHVRACRVCCRAYHDSCLAKIGHPLSASCRLLIAADRWSCHQCASLNNLLTQEEVTNILKILDDLDISKDNITEANYLRFYRHCLHGYNREVTAELESQIIQQFNSVGQVQAGLISFTQFLNLEAVRVLSMRSKDSLVHLLTQAELAEAKRMFQKSDNWKTGHTCKTGMNPTSPVTMTWPVFLRDTALDLISQRSNPRLAESPGSGRHDTDDATLTFSSCDSVDVDEDRYSTCNSEPEPPGALNDASASQCRQLETGLAADDRLGKDSSRTTMLDDIQAHIDETHRCHDLYVRQAESAMGIVIGEEVSSAGSHLETTDLAIQQIQSHKSPRASRQTASFHTSDQCADNELRTSAQSSPDSVMHDILTPRQDVENRSNQKRRTSSSPTAVYRKSEVISRRAVTGYHQNRAVSQAGRKYTSMTSSGTDRP